MIPIAFRARREALGLNQAECASVFGVTQAAVSRWETGARTIPAGVVEELDALEQTAEKLIDDALDAVEQVGVEDAALFVYADDAALWAAHPEMDGLPAVVHRVAMALAARECEGVPLQTSSWASSGLRGQLGGQLGNQLRGQLGDALLDVADAIREGHTS